ncbi:MAG TPA: LL-diaminopimelate aminotransferase [Bacillota bacterium]|nr:LL-diaminopimelate aminotransferase [Bacillota bacterium]HOH10725.1 LL-diaminopimelate aminotransferase [Bacillota bacterium]HOY88529.1 LL-diaminopimelate aminotransferase [Bacillota bacterium]HPI01501.1 LL-diaminopimelate aminotransferase [Bacillota bacterium]HPM64276.1 LL-diaminopimelate aminotransferase [Bacillota bacterium]
MIRRAQRIQNLQPYLFAQIEAKIEKARREGRNIISLGIGDPDMPTPEHVVEAGVAGMRDPKNHQYPSSKGMGSFRKAVADYYKRRFDVGLDPDRQVCSLIGSKEGIAHISLCFTDPGKYNLIPDPGYPVYEAGTVFAGGIPYYMPLLKKNGFLPDFSEIPSDVAKNTALMFLNYPNNPTGACADGALFDEAVAFAAENDIILVHDSAYAEMTYDGSRPPSVLNAKGAMDLAIEFGSLSKYFNMTGWRIGWAVGNPDAVGTLAALKSNLDSGAFQAVQVAATAAMNGPWDSVDSMREVYRKRRDKVVGTMRELGCELEYPNGSIYVWVPVPEGYTSAGFAEHVFDRTGVVITPGNGYGRHGEGYFRISLTIADDDLDEALSRFKAQGIRF